MPLPPFKDPRCDHRGFADAQVEADHLQPLHGLLVLLPIPLTMAARGMYDGRLDAQPLILNLTNSYHMRHAVG